MKKNSELDRMLSWVLVTLFCCGMVIGCNYTEGDDKAAQAFNLMTTKEKLIYDRAAKNWNEKVLMPIRQAVHKRQAPPSEDFYSFADITEIVKSVNEVNMAMDPNWGADQTNKKTAAKFSNIDPEWYRSVILKGDTAEIKKLVEKAKADAEKLAALEAAAKEKEEKDQVRDEQPKSQPVAYIAPKPVYEESVNLSDLVPEHEYSDIQFEITGCQPAIDHLNDIITNYRRPITHADREELIKLSLYCKTVELGELVNGD